MAGWFVTEVGRQPYLAYGILRTKEMISPVDPSLVGISLVTLIVVYTFIFGSAGYYIYRQIQKGPESGDWEETYGQHGLKQPATISHIFPRTLEGIHS